MRHIITFSFCLVLIQSLSAEPELKGSPSELAAYLGSLPKTVGVTGESELKVQADRAIIGLRVTTENKSLQEALRANQEVRSKILNSLKDHDIGADRIQASKFSSTPKYGMFGDKARSYRVENIIKITVIDEKQFQAAARLVDALPEVQYLGIDFEHSDKEALKKKAIAQALDHAIERTKLYEERLKVRLVPKSFSETAAVSQGAPPAMPRIESTVFPARAKAPTPIPGATRDYAPAAMEEGVSLFGELFFMARVVVDYAVESK